MTESTPPPGRDHDSAGSEAEFGDAVDATVEDADLDLVHASIDGELSETEEAAITPDEQWRARVSQARAARDAAQQALGVPPVDDERREAHITAALAAFDELATESDAGASTAGANDPPPGAGDELAHRRRAKAWVGKLPIGIAAAVLAAVVVIGATQLGDDDTDTVASGGLTFDDAGVGDSGEDDAGRAAEDAESAGPEPESAADSDSATADTAAAEMVHYTLSDQADSLDAFVDAVFATVRDESDDEASEELALYPTAGGAPSDGDCDDDAVIDLADPEDPANLTLVQGEVRGRPIVGVIDRSDPDQVTIIDLDRCEVVDVRSP